MSLDGLSIDRFVVRYRVYGDPDSPNTMVCVNGAQQTIAAWKSLVGFFRKKYKIILFDLPGQGGSRIRLGGHHVSLAEQCRVMEALVERLVVDDKIDILTASWGGAVGALYSARNPARVRKLLLGSFGLTVNRAMLDLIRLGQELIAAGEIGRCGQIIADSFGSRLAPARRENIRRQFREMDPDAVQHFLEHIRWSAGADLREEIAFEDIRADTLIANGREDAILDPETLDALVAAIPRARRVLVEGAGHFMHFENPDILNLYDDFYSGRDKTAGARPVPEIGMAPAHA
jgi:pimeloyl-ACP methyl ester carboxylesterase